MSLGVGGEHDSDKDGFHVKNVFWWGEGERNHKIFAKDLAGNADSRNMLFLSVILIWKITSVVDNGLPGGAVIKNPPADGGEAGDLGSLPGLGRCPRVGNGLPLQYSCLEIFMDRGAWSAIVHRVAKSQTDWAGMHTDSRNIFFLSVILIWRIIKVRENRRAQPTCRPPGQGGRTVNKASWTDKSWQPQGFQKIKWGSVHLNPLRLRRLTPGHLQDWRNEKAY